MTEYIKKRIEQIQRGDAPTGYKKTKVGIIPIEWDVFPVDECVIEYKMLSNDIKNIPVYSSSRKGLVPQSEFYERKEATETNLGYKVVPRGYVTYRHMSDDDVFHFNINNAGNDILVSSEYPVFTASPMAELAFLIPILNETSRFKYFCRMQKLGGTRTRLYFKNLGKYLVGMPQLPEQQKIAKILATQDKLIELQQCKIEELKKLKKACLQKMFPQKGKDVPEVRFPGFTDAWEQRKLGEITDSYSGGTPSVGVKEYYGGNIPFIRSAEINSDHTELLITQKGLDNSSARITNIGDILYALYGATSGEVGRARLKGAVNQAILVIQPHEYYSPEYLTQWLRKNKQMIIDTYLQGGQGNLSGTIVKDLVIDCPTVDEQEAIGTFFQNLDNLITLHQRKLEEMQQMKKSLMQLLLTGVVRVQP